MHLVLGLGLLVLGIVGNGWVFYTLVTQNQALALRNETLEAQAIRQGGASHGWGRDSFGS